MPGMVGISVTVDADHVEDIDVVGVALAEEGMRVDAVTARSESFPVPSSRADSQPSRQSRASWPSNWSSTSTSAVAALNHGRRRQTRMLRAITPRSSAISDPTFRNVSSSLPIGSEMSSGVPSDLC